MIDPLLQLPGYQLRRASALCFVEITARLAPFGVRPTEASILTLIAHNSLVTQSDIGGHLGIQRANMTPIIARLEELGWVGREPIDGRSQGLMLTTEGEVIQKQLWPEMVAYEAELVARVLPEHRDQVLPVLKALWGGRA